MLSPADCIPYVCVYEYVCMNTLVYRCLETRKEENEWTGGKQPFTFDFKALPVKWASQPDVKNQTVSLVYWAIYTAWSLSF